MAVQARAFWLREPGAGEIRRVAVPDPGPGEVRVRTLLSGDQPWHRVAGLLRRRTADQRAGCAPRSRRASSPGR